MKKNVRTLNRSEAVGARLLWRVMSLLASSESGSMAFADIRSSLSSTEDFNEWELFRYEKSGMERWHTFLSFYSSRYFRAGLLFRQQHGLWSITEAGAQAIDTMDAERLFFYATDTAEERVQLEASDSVNADNGEPLPVPINYESLAHDDVMSFLLAVDPYVFQCMVAALLRGMGYHVPFVAPKGKDGGVDVIAYFDPLGASGSILKVQVKRYSLDNLVAVDVVRSILGVSHNAIPIIVTTGRFSEQARAEARLNNVRLIDGVEFVQLWIRYFDQMCEEDRALMPIRPYYFINRD